MRVIGGEFRSRVLKSLPGLDVRPTPDRLREALFNILMPRLAGKEPGKTFADLYAGTGAVGIEALSRGAAQAIFVEQKHAAVRVIHENLKALGIETRAKVHEGKVKAIVARLQANIVFLDPPYPLEQEYAATLAALGAREFELVIAQHPPQVKLEEAYGALRRTRQVKQGDNELSFYEG